MTISVWEIAWLAGLLEGEGCFGYYPVKNSTSSRPFIQLAMTDRDVVERAAKLLSTSVAGPYQPRTTSSVPGVKCQYRATIADRRAVAWMMTLWSFMGERRRQKIEEVIAAWSTPPAPRQPRVPECGHPTRKYCAHGKCRQCYHRDWYRSTQCAHS